MAKHWVELAARLEMEASEDDRHTLLQQVAARQVPLSTTAGPLGGAPQPSPTAYTDLLSGLLYSILTDAQAAATVRPDTRIVVRRHVHMVLTITWLALRAAGLQSAKYIDVILREGGHAFVANKLKYFAGTPRFSQMHPSVKLQVRRRPILLAATALARTH